MATKNFLLEADPADKLKFEGDLEQPIKVELKIKNTTDSNQAIKVKCTDNDLFRIRPPTGILKSKDSITVNVTFNPPADKKEPKGQHHFVILHTEQGDAKNARAAFEKNPGDSRKTIPVEFNLKEGGGKKEEKEKEEKKDDEKDDKKGKESEKKGKDEKKDEKEEEKEEGGKEEGEEKGGEEEKEGGEDEKKEEEEGGEEKEEGGEEKEGEDKE